MSSILNRIEYKGNDPREFGGRLFGGGKGGGFDTSGMEAAARESNALQRQMYEEAVARGEPFYQGGLGGFKTLLDYLGLEGGNTRQSRESIYSELKPQYTQQSTTYPLGEGLYIDPQGQIVTYEGAKKGISDKMRDMMPGQSLGIFMDKYFDDRATSIFGSHGYKPLQTTSQTTDTEALNAAIEARLAQQEAAGVPDYFGSLLQPFSMDKFEADPSYQFRQAEGQKAIERAMAARGQSFTPAAIQALQGYNQDLASQEFGNAYNRYNIDQGNIYNRLAGIAGMGQQQIGQLNQAGQTYASNVGATNASLAQSQLAAAQAQASNKGSMFGGLLGLGGSIIGGGLAGGYF